MCIRTDQRSPMTQKNDQINMMLLSNYGQASCWFDVKNAAPDVDAIRCTGGCLVSEKLHPTPPRSNGRQLMPKLLHPIAMRLDALAIVWLSDCCTRPWNGQMHADSCLLRKLVAVSWLQRHSRWNVEDFAFNAEIVECTDDFVCCQKCCWQNCLLTQTRRLMLADAADWLTGCRTSYWLTNRNVDSLQLMINFCWFDYWKLDKTKWIDSYETF